MIVRVPASSANLGPGFDTLGMALSMYAEAGLVGDGVPPGARVADEHHPATGAFRRGGGVGEIWTQTNIPMGRGLGFSGAVRVAGLVAAHLQQTSGVAADLLSATDEILAMATELEGHADNVAASLLGGIVATAGGRAVRIPLGFDPAVVVWVPSFTTSTNESRTRLSATVERSDAVFNIGRTALLVAALAAGDIDSLAAASADRLHQDVRLAAAAPSRGAIEAALSAGAWSAWLSGSGPTVAAFCDPERAAAIAAALPGGGTAKILHIDHAGVTVDDGDVRERVGTLTP